MSLEDLLTADGSSKVKNAGKDLLQHGRDQKVIRGAPG